MNSEAKEGSTLRIPGSLVLDSDGTYVFLPSAPEGPTVHGRLFRPRPEYLESIPFGFMLEDNEIVANRILEILWHEGPASPLWLMIRIPGVNHWSVYNRLQELVRNGDVIQTKRGVYSVPLDALQRRIVHDFGGKPHLLEDIRPIVEGTIDQLLQRFGGTCRVSVKKFSNTVIKMSGLDIRRARRKRRLMALVDEFLEQDSRATFCGYSYKDGASKEPIQSRLYELKAEKASPGAIPQLAPREPSTSTVDTAARVISLLLKSKGMNIMELSNAIGTSPFKITHCIDHLIDECVLEKSRTGFVTIFPQKRPERVRVLQMLAEKGLNMTVHTLVLEYLKQQVDVRGKNSFRLSRLKKCVWSHLGFLTVREPKAPLREVLDALCLSGQLESAEGDWYMIKFLEKS